MKRTYGAFLTIGIAGVLLSSFAVVRPRPIHREQSAQPAGPSAMEEAGERRSMSMPVPPAVPQSNRTSPKQKMRRTERPLRKPPTVMGRVTEEAKQRPADRTLAMSNRVSAPDPQVTIIRKGSPAPRETPGPRFDEQMIVAPPPTDAETAAPPARSVPVLTPPVLLETPHVDPLDAYEVVLERGELAPQLRVRLLEGHVVLRVLVLADGSVARTEIERSSGHATLDQAALTSARSWRFDPARRDGTPIDAWALIPVRFVLR